MAVTATNLKNLILVKVGEDAESAGPVAAVIEVLWDFHADKALIAPRLQYLHTLKEALEIKMGALPDGDLMEVGLDNKDLSARETFNSWKDIYNATLADIARVEATYRNLRTVAVDSITTQTPLSPDSDPSTVGYPDPGARSYRGDTLMGRSSLRRRIY